ncbi:hypothetical protein HYV31_01870 [candidate division WWE3 bacterium]|nr:hypothetical protein [candidate division WWE3 bacterium]
MVLNTGLNSLKARDIFKGDVKIIKKSKPGPVVFIVTNGLGAVEAVKKDSDFEVGDVVYIEGEVNEHKGRIQIELSKITKSNMNFDAIMFERAKPIQKDFSIASERYETMRETIVAIATKIRLSILEGQPIMIRHHNDADGIISGITIEKACLGLMESFGIDPRYMLFRSPSKAPFYASGDVFRDLVLSKRFVEADSNMKPLIIVADNGSTPEDAFGLSTLKTLGYEAIVIDHHNPIVLNDGVTAVDKYLALHLNPYKLGLDGKTSAGMLCYEIARFIWENYSNPILPAIAGILDRCEIQETEDYIAKSGKSREDLAKVGTAIDYISYQLKHDAGKGVYEELFSNTDFVEIVNTEVRKGFETQLQSTLPYLRNQEINDILLSTIDVSKYTMKFTYPSPGLVISRVHEITSAEHEASIVITLGHMEDMIIIRADKPILPVSVIMKNLKAKYPNANVEGGGHDVAGTIRFVSAFGDTILEEIKNMIKELKIEETIDE